MENITITFEVSYFAYQLSVAAYYNSFKHMPNKEQVINQLKRLLHEYGYYIGSLCTPETKELASTDMVIKYTESLFPELYK